MFLQGPAPDPHGRARGAPRGGQARHNGNDSNRINSITNTNKKL